MKTPRILLSLLWVLLLSGACLLWMHPVVAQETTAKSTEVTAKVGGDEDGGSSLIFEAKGIQKKVPLFFRAVAESSIRVGINGVTSTVNLKVEVIQGKSSKFSLGVGGDGTVRQVIGEGLKSWAVRNEGEAKFLDLEVIDERAAYEFQLISDLKLEKLPASAEFWHLRKGDAVGFASTVSITSDQAMDTKVLAANGFLPLESKEENTEKFTTSDGGNLSVNLSKSGAAADAAELAGTRLEGKLSADGKSVAFTLTGTARISKAGSSLTILTGEAAITHWPQGGRLKLLPTADGRSRYDLEFDEAGEFPLSLQFATRVQDIREWKKFAFQIPGGAVVPVVLTGPGESVEFDASQQVRPERVAGQWIGFLPASGVCSVAWKSTTKAGAGKLFYTSTSRINVGVGAGVLRQSSEVEFNILQGELASLSFQLEGGGEILEVTGPNILRWEVDGPDGAVSRKLTVRLSKPITTNAVFGIRSQVALGDFPLKVSPLRVTPEGAVRHSGYIRVFNQGAVRVAVGALTGLTQLAPEQFPMQALPAGLQVFAYRFPAQSYSYELSADRIQPEIHVLETVYYDLQDADRAIQDDIELDIRDATIREYTIEIPENYDVLTLEGAKVADHVEGTEVVDGYRSLRILFNGDVMGKQLVKAHLERKMPAAEGDWELPRIRFAGAKSVRGSVGVASVPGYRIEVGQVDDLVEKPLAYFLKEVKGLQQAFRIRQPEWTATMKITKLPQVVQADVFHVYSLKDGTGFGSVLLNYFVAGAPVSEFKLAVPEDIENVVVLGRNVRSSRRDREGGQLIVTLQQPVLGLYSLLVTCEELVGARGGVLKPGRVAPLDVRGERGFVQVVSPVQVQTSTKTTSPSLISIDPLELPGEFRFLSVAPSLAAWQYTSRPFDLELDVTWYDPGETVAQVVELAEVSSRISRDGQVVTEVVYLVKSRGRRLLKFSLPGGVDSWGAQVNGTTVTSIIDGESMRIPLPPGAFANERIEVRIRYGKSNGDSENPVLALPRVEAPVLMTQWTVEGGDDRTLVATSDSIDVPQTLLKERGVEWIGRTESGIGGTLAMLLLVFGGVFLTRIKRSLAGSLFGIALLTGAIAISIWLAVSGYEETEPRQSELKVELSMLEPAAEVQMTVANLTDMEVNFSMGGLILIVVGSGLIVFAFGSKRGSLWLALAGGVLAAAGILWQRGGAPWFFTAAAVLLVVILIVSASDWFKFWNSRVRPIGPRSDSDKESDSDDTPSPDSPASPGTGSGAATALLLLGLGLGFSLGTGNAHADKQAAAPQVLVETGFSSADLVTQTWDVEKDRLKASATLQVTGKSGDQFILLNTPAVLTKFEGAGLRLSKQSQKDGSIRYVVHITGEVEGGGNQCVTATFSYEMNVSPQQEWRIPTGAAAVQEITALYDKVGWEFSSGAAMQTLAVENLPAGKSGARLILAPRAGAGVILVPVARDFAAEETRFFVEVSNLYLPSPGVVDGRHEIRVRPSQGQVSEVTVSIPEGLTVSDVGGGSIVGQWQFDADQRTLRIPLSPPQSKPFVIGVATQRSLDPLPTETKLAPLTVGGATGEVGMLALAFGSDVQPEKETVEKMSSVNLSDFSSDLMPDAPKAVLHSVYRYGAEPGTLTLRLAPVAPEVRLSTQEKFSLGDERLLMEVAFTANITRAGIFQLSFPVPDGLEVETLSGESLNHWSEQAEEGKRIVTMHLKGKTMGAQEFVLTLTGPPPADDQVEWVVPRFQLLEAARQTGELSVTPTTGIRLRTIERLNASEENAAELGARGEGALAFRLLQQDWSLKLGIERLDPWVTGQVLHEVTLLDGQTRTKVLAQLKITNASLRTLKVFLPKMTDDEKKTVRASGSAVSDLVASDADDGSWVLRFKRRMVGDLNVNFEWERTGERTGGVESLDVVKIDELRQTSTNYYVIVRAGARLDLGTPDVMPKGWQGFDWNAVPSALRDAGNRSIPALSLRAKSPEQALQLRVRRNSAAEALKLRVASGKFTTLISPGGDFLTAAAMKLEVIQRSTLSVDLPKGGHLYNVFVNGESVSLVRSGSVHQFYVIPGADERTAEVNFVYSLPGEIGKKVKFGTPRMNVPLENIEWRVVIPDGYALQDYEGELEKRTDGENLEKFDRDSYLAAGNAQQEQQKRQAQVLLRKASADLKSGDQKSAAVALSQVAGNVSLDAASNEDVRVQLQKIQQQQAMVGLNTRRQRIYLYNKSDDAGFARNPLLEQAASRNTILQQGDMKFRGQEVNESQLLVGNTPEEISMMRQIANRLVLHQKATEPAPQAIRVLLPENGSVVTFTRAVQVNDSEPLELELELSREKGSDLGRILVAFLLVALLVAGIVLIAPRGKRDGETS